MTLDYEVFAVFIALFGIAGLLLLWDLRGDGMNHDRAHCIDFSPDCPESCFRAELTREALEKHWAIVDWSHFQGTEECKKKEVTE